MGKSNALFAASVLPRERIRVLAKIQIRSAMGSAFTRYAGRSRARLKL